MTNTLAYFKNLKIMAVKRFIVQAPGVCAQLKVSEKSKSNGKLASCSKKLSTENTLGYFFRASVTKKKILMTLTPVANVIKLFMVVIYLCC